MSSKAVLFGSLFSTPQKNGLTRPKAVRGAGIPMVNMGELFAYPRIKNLVMDLVTVSDGEAHFLLEPEDLLFARQSLVLEGAGQCSIFVGNKKPTVFESHLIRCRLNKSIANPYFYFYFFRSPAGRTAIETIAEQGAGASGIRGSDLVKLSVPFPPKVQQDAVAEVLTALDDRISVLRETNATLEAIAQALFKSWFVDFDPVRAKMESRAPEGMDETTAALFPDGFEASVLGEVPRGWAIRTMADVSTVGIGKTPPRKEQHWFSEDPSDVRWVSIRDMGAVGAYAALTNEFLTKEAVERFNVRRVPDNTVLMSFKMTIGRVAITDGEMTTNEAIAHFKLAANAQLTTEYIYLHLKQFNFSTLSSTSSIADAVNSKTVREIPILVPSPEVLAVFQSQVGALFGKLKNTEQHAQTLATLRDTLLPRLISGQLRLPESREFPELPE